MPISEWVGYDGQSFSLKLVSDPDEAVGSRGACGRNVELRFRSWDFDLHSSTLVSRVEPALSNQLISDCQILALDAWFTLSDRKKGTQRVARSPLTTNWNPLLLNCDDNTVEWLEEVREGGAVTIQVSITALCTVPDLTLPLATSPTQGNGAPLIAYPHVLRRFGPMSQAVTFDRERWLAILHGMGWGTTRLLELPSTELPSPGGQWNGVLQCLQKATNTYQSGDYEETMRHVRIGIKGVAQEVAIHWKLPPYDKTKKFTSWTKELAGRLANAWPQDEEAAKLLSQLFDSA